MDEVRTKALNKAENNPENKAGEKPLTVIFAAGGTGGHIYPALAVATALRQKRPSAQLLFCGTPEGMESRLVPQAGFDFYPLEARGFPHRPGRQFLLAYQAYRRGKRTAEELIRHWQPDAVVGTGGYVCGPLLAAAGKLKIPRLIHEQNAIPGRSNRLMSIGAEVVCTGYPNTERYFKRARHVIWTGNPVRAVFYRLNREEARRQLGLPQGQKLILATGGSLGARRINKGVIDMLRLHPELAVNVILAAGDKLEQEARTSAADLPGDRLQIHSYLSDLYLYMAAADLVICRSGAGTCAELGALGRASVLVPYPYAANDHQRFNAQAYSERGAALYCPDELCSGERLAEAILPLLEEPERLHRMEERLKEITAPPATAQIVEILCGLIDEAKKGGTGGNKTR